MNNIAGMDGFRRASSATECRALWRIARAILQRLDSKLVQPLLRRKHMVSSVLTHFEKVFDIAVHFHQ